MTASTLVLFTRDLRVHDHPALAAAADAGPVVPLFVLDESLLASRNSSPNRAAFLVDCLHDLRRSLSARGTPLIVRRGDVITETMRVARATNAAALHVMADVSAHAKRRERLLEEACSATGVQLRRFPGVTVVPPGELRTGHRDHYRVFTPYWRVWRAHRWRPVAPAPRRLQPAALPPDHGTIPAAPSLVAGASSPLLPRGGEGAGRRLMHAWLRTGVSGHGASHDDLAGMGTSRLSPYLHFGCVSPLELVTRAEAAGDAEAFVRQLCWRDFHHQVTDAFPAIEGHDYRPRGQRWLHRPQALEAWKRGETGVPVVDAAMRQLLAQGWMPNRARLIAAGYLVRTLGIDWREGERHFMRWLVDGDVANNAGNWQWVAGTGNDTRPNRGFNVERQSRRFDSDGAYVRLHAPELAGATT